MNKKITITIISVLILALLAGGFWYWKSQKTEVSQQAEQVKNNQESEIDTSNWKTYRDEKYGFEIKYPEELYIKNEGIHKYQEGDYFVRDYEEGLFIIVSNNKSILDESFSHGRDHIKIDRDGSFYLELTIKKPRDPGKLTDELLIDWIDGEENNIEIKTGTINKLKVFIAPEWREHGLSDFSRKFIFKCNNNLVHIAGYIYGEDKDYEFKFVENIIQTFECLN